MRKQDRGFKTVKIILKSGPAAAQKFDNSSIFREFHEDSARKKSG